MIQSTRQWRGMQLLSAQGPMPREWRQHWLTVDEVLWTYLDGDSTERTDRIERRPLVGEVRLNHLICSAYYGTLLD